MADNQFQSTTEWYIKWLTERRPDLTPEQVQEMATGFAMQQAPVPARPVEDDAEEDSEPTAEETREEQRSRARLTEKELAAIIGPEALEAK